MRCGPGAAILPAEVTRIHMDFARSIDGGHAGAKKFWRESLPRLKYHNPSVPMIVNRHTQNASPATMSIYLRKPDAGPTPESRPQPASSRDNLSKAVPPAADERVVTLDMSKKHSSHILEFLLAETRATPLQPTPDEIREIQSLEVLRKMSEDSFERVRQFNAEKKREKDMLERARAAGGVIQEE